MSVKSQNPELQLQANIRMRTSRIHTREATLHRLKNQVSIYEEALDRAQNQLFAFENQQQSDVNELRGELDTLRQIELLKEQVVHNISDFRPVHFDQLKEKY